jgi:hypothetical protein
VEKQSSSGLLFLGTYTFSKSIDDASSWGDQPQDPNNLRAERGLSAFDARHRISVGYVYPLPWGKTRRFLGGWLISGIFSLQSGRPLTVSTSDRSNTGIGTRNRPNAIGDPMVPRNRRSIDNWFDPAAFTLQPLYTFGTAGRNTLIGPGVNVADLALSKNLPIGEGKKLQVRVEAFNLANHPNFDNPNTQFDSPQFGKILSAENSERQIQFALSYVF